MPGWASASRFLPLALLGLAALLLAPPADAAPHRVAAAAAQRQTKRKKAPAGKEQLTSPGEASAGSVAKDLGSSGQVDPLSGLGIRNPVCDQASQIRDRQTRLACESAGAPESNYPASNYGFDIFIATGVTHPIGDLTYGFATVLNGIWLGLLFVLKLVFSLLGLAFGLNPFAEGPTMSRISVAIGRIYAEITDPWLSALIVCGGVWFAYKGLLRREVAAGVAGTLAGIAMLILGLWVIHQPGASVGQLAALSDEVALGVVSAPQSGSLSRPSGTYAEAMSRTWARLVEVPFAGLDFSDVGWALGPPPAEAVQKADEKFCDDVGALALLAVLSHLGNEDAKKACASFARKRYGAPRRVVDLYLRSSPNSPAREALWHYFDGSERYKAKVAAQGGDGVLTRLSMLALFAIGLLGAILLLAWLAIRLFTQAAIAFVLLLAAPYALFFPLLGDSGRSAFKTWGLTLLGACLSKAIYAAFLSVVLLGISILGASGGATGFLLACAFTWAIFLKRAQLVGWMSIGEADRAGHLGIVPVLAGFGLARSGRRMVKGTARAGVGLARTHSAERGAATRQTAHEELREQAGALADARHREAKRTVERLERRYGVESEARTAGGEPRLGEARGRRPSPEEKASYVQAKDLLVRVRGNERRLGTPFSERDLERFALEDGELLRSSRSPADHAHRAGIDREEFEAMRGPEREEAEAAIEHAAKRDRRRLAVSSELPGRIAGRPRQLAEGISQRTGEGAAMRREHLRRLRRERIGWRAPDRRNLSRGA